MIPHFENLFPNFFHTENMASRNSSSVEAQPESVDPIFESPIFLKFDKDQKEKRNQPWVRSKQCLLAPA